MSVLGVPLFHVVEEGAMSYVVWDGLGYVVVAVLVMVGAWYACRVWKDWR